MKTSHLGTAALLLCVALAAKGLAASYSVTSLGHYGGRFVNDHGQVLLAEFTQNLPFHYWLYDHGSLTDLASLGHTNGIPLDMNNDLQIIGNYTISAPPGFKLGAYVRDYASGNLTEVGTIAGGNGAALFGNNDQGAAVGFYSPAANQTTAMLFQNGTIHDLGYLGGNYSEAHAINELGQIVGKSSPADGSDAKHAFLYDATGMHDLGVLAGYANSEALGINDQGDIIGLARNDALSDPRGFQIVGGLMQDLGTLGGAGSTPRAINAAGQIVGDSQLADGTARPFLFENGAMVDLNSLIDPASGWVLSFTGDINDAGQIVGTGTFGGVDTAFLLTPVPEPSSLTVAALAFLGLAIYRWRQRG